MRKIFTHQNVSKSLGAIVLLVISALSANAQMTYNVTLAQQCTTLAGGVVVSTFNTPNPPASNGTLTIVYLGDLDGGPTSTSNPEYLDFLGEGSTLLGQSVSIGQCSNTGTFTYSIPQATLASWIATGNDVVITTDAHPNVQPNNGLLCGPNSFCVTASLSYQYIVAPEDISPVALVSPTVPPFCYTATDSVVVTIANTGVDTVFFAIDTATINAVIGGPNPTTVSYQINTGSLAPGQTMDVNILPVYDMSAYGTYTFDISTSMLPADSNLTNDTLPTVLITNSSSPGTLTASTSSICNGGSATLTLTGNTGIHQWQSNDGSGWVNMPNTATSITVSPTVTTDYRVDICSGALTTSVVTINVITPAAPTVVGATHCGWADSLMLTASGTGNLYWFNSPTGGVQVAAGDTFYTPFLLNTTTYYVENQVPGGSSTVGMPNNLSGGGVPTVGWGLNFTVNNPVVLDSFAIYPNGTGSVEIEVVSVSGSTVTPLFSTPALNYVNALGTKQWVPLNWSLQPGTYRVRMKTIGSGIVQLYSDAGTTVTFPYASANNDLVIMQGFTGSPTLNNYMYFYDWRITGSCNSARVPVTATITTAPAVSISATDTNICQNDTISLFANSSSSGYNYTWGPNADLSSTTGPSVQVWPSNTIAYHVYGIDPGTGCEAYDTLTINTFNVPISIPTATPGTVCSGGNVQLSVTNPTTGMQYSWTSTSPPTPASVHNPNVAPTTGTSPDTIYYTVTVVEPTSGCFRTGTTSVIVNPGTSVNIGPDTVVCQYSNITIDAGANYNTYLWNNGQIGQIRYIPAIPFTQAVVVTVTNQYGCAAVDSRLFTVIPSPSINLGPDRSLCVNHTMQLNAGSGHTSYLWSTGDTTAITSIGPNASSGYVWVKVTNAAGCSNADTIYVTVDPCSGISENLQEEDLSIYPNPNRGNFFLQMNAGPETDARLEIINIQGQTVHSEQVQLQPGFKQELQLNNPPPGIYFVRLYSDDMMVTRRIIIQ